MAAYQIGDHVLGSWKLVRVLGQGSFGTVYEAHREDFGMVYKAAIKIVSVPYTDSEITSARAEGMDDHTITEYFRSVVQEIVAEFALMSRLKGTANVVSYEDHAVIPRENGIGWDIIIRMELLTPLLDHMSGQNMTRMDIIQLGIDMCKALELCQRYNIIHRDIKPENMFVSELGDYKLGDFGIARTLEKTTGGLSKKGTYTYMAPEIYKDEPYGSNVDIYSLGIVMYRLLNNNRAPFLPPAPAPISHNEREAALVRRIRGESLPKPANAEGRLAEIVLKACAYHPGDRYSSPVQLRQDLESIAYNRREDDIVNRGQSAIEISKTAFRSTTGQAASDQTAAMEPEERTAVAYAAERENIPEDMTVVSYGKDPGKARKTPLGKILAAAALICAAILCAVLLPLRSKNGASPAPEMAAATETTVPETTAEVTVPETTEVLQTTQPPEATAPTTAPTEPSLYPDLPTDEEGFVILDNSGMPEGAMCVLGYKVSDGSKLVSASAYPSGSSTCIAFSWEKTDATTTTLIANWKAVDFSASEIATQKGYMLSAWKNDGLMVSIAPESGIQASFPVVSAQDCYVLLLSLDKEMEVVKHTVLKIGYV